MPSTAELLHAVRAEMLDAATAHDLDDEDGLPDETRQYLSHLAGLAKDPAALARRLGVELSGYELASFDESKHHRGQPENAGQFGPGGGDAPPAADADRPQKRWKPATDIKSYGDKYWSEWANALNEDEKAAILFYKKDSTPINQVLRDETYFRRQEHENHKKHLTRLVEKAQVPHDIIVYRGARAEFYDNLYEGKVFRDNGFVSTSIDRETMDSFSDPHGEGHATAEIAVLVPKGSKGAFISKVNNDDFSDELLLQRGSLFKVVKKKGNRIVLKLMPRRSK